MEQSINAGGVISLPEVISTRKNKQVKRSYNHIKGEKIFKGLLNITGLLLILMVFAILVTLVLQSLPAFRALGLKFFWTSTWNPVTNVFGAVPFLLGTLITSFLALVICVPFAVSVAILLGEYFPKGGFSNFMRSAIELIAAVPSVIFGFWGFFVLVPLVRTFEIKIGVTPNGLGLLSSALVLAIMVIPYAASLGTTMIRMVPSHLKEGAYALGATRWEVLRSVILPYSKSGLFAGILLSLGRAIGETMAVTMVIGNSSELPKSIFATGNTMASVIANEFGAAADPVYISALVELGLFLFLVTFVINWIGKIIIKRTGKK